MKLKIFTDLGYLQNNKLNQPQNFVLCTLYIQYIFVRMYISYTYMLDIRSSSEETHVAIISI